MIPLIEDILVDTIKLQLKVIQTNVNIIDKIFSTASTETKQRIKQYLSSNEIRVIRGFPIDPAKLPSFCVMLGAEQEQVAGLGNFLETELDDFESETVVENNIPITKLDDFYFITTTKRPILEVFELAYDGDVFDLSLLEIIDYRKGIVKLNIPIDESVTKASLSYRYQSTAYTQEGTIFNSQYRVETWTNNGDLTIYLYYLLKWILLSNRLEMAKKGLFIQGLGGMDFEPAPEYFPEFVYRRALTFDCQTESFFEISNDIIEKIDTDLT